MRLAFLGTPEAAVPSLRALVDAGHDVAIVITRPDRKRGRGGELSPSPVKACAQELGLRVAHRLSDLDELDVERGVVVAYGRLIPGGLLARVPMLNVHFSLLPRWRGAAPVERAILAGDVETGVSIMTLDVDLDTGPVHLERRVAIGDKTLATLLDELADVGARALDRGPRLAGALGPPASAGGRGHVRRKVDQGRLSSHARHRRPRSCCESFDSVRPSRSWVAGDSWWSARRATTASMSPPESIALRDARVVLGASSGAIALERVRPESAKVDECDGVVDGRPARPRPGHMDVRKPRHE